MRERTETYETETCHSATWHRVAITLLYILESSSASDEEREEKLRERTETYETETCHSATKYHARNAFQNHLILYNISV